MPVVIPKISRKSALPLGLDILSQSQSNGYRITVYFSNKPYNLLQRQLRFRLAQLIARVETLEQEDDLWILEGEHGRLVFSRHENWTFVTLMQ